MKGINAISQLCFRFVLDSADTLPHCQCITADAELLKFFSFKPEVGQNIYICMWPCMFHPYILISTYLIHSTFLNPLETCSMNRQLDFYLCHVIWWICFTSLIVLTFIFTKCYMPRKSTQMLFVMLHWSVSMKITVSYTHRLTDYMRETMCVI